MIEFIILMVLIILIFVILMMTEASCELQIISSIIGVIIVVVFLIGLTSISTLQSDNNEYKAVLLKNNLATYSTSGAIILK